MGIAETYISSDFGTDEIGLFVRFILAPKFHFGHHQTFVVTIKLINLEGMVATFHEITPLIHKAAFAQRQQMFGLVERDFLLKLIARQTAVVGMTFNCELRLVVTHAYAHSGTFSRNISLLDMTARNGGAFERVAFLN